MERVRVRRKTDPEQIVKDRVHEGEAVGIDRAAPARFFRRQPVIPVSGIIPDRISFPEKCLQFFPERVRKDLRRLIGSLGQELLLRYDDRLRLFGSRLLRNRFRIRGIFLRDGLSGAFRKRSLIFSGALRSAHRCLLIGYGLRKRVLLFPALRSGFLRFREQFLRFLNFFSPDGLRIHGRGRRKHPRSECGDQQQCR